MPKLDLPITRQTQRLGIFRGSVYYHPKPPEAGFPGGLGSPVAPGSLSDLKGIGGKSVGTVPILRLCWAIEQLLPGNIVKICPRPAEFSLRFFKSDKHPRCSGCLRRCHPEGRPTATVGRHSCRQTNPSAQGTAIAASFCHHFLRGYGKMPHVRKSLEAWTSGQLRIPG
jgi:hypothetical protein